MAASANLSLSIQGTLTNPIDLKTGAAPLSYVPLFSFVNGSGANQITQMFTDSRTLASGASENLDLSGVLVNVFNQTLLFTNIRLLSMRSPSTNVNTIRFGPGSSNGWTTAFGDASDRLVLRPGGCIILVAPDPNGYAVTAGTGDILTVTNTNDIAAEAQNYEIILMGVTP